MSLVIPRVCYLDPVVIGRDQIQLPHEETVLIDGCELFPDSSRAAGLRLMAMANCDTGYVTVQVMGTLPCKHKGRVLTRGAKYMFGPGNVLQLCGDFWEFDYEVCFNPPVPDYVMQVDFPELLEKSTLQPQFVPNHQVGAWQEGDGEKVLVYTPNLVNHSSAVAAFSLDDVLVKANTWTLKYDNIESRLEKLQSSKYKIAAFVNQPTIGRQRGNMQAYKEKVDAFLNQTGLPIQVFVCTGDSKYKKPAPLMWRLMAENFNANVIIEPDRCFYVGSSQDLTDRLLAINLDVTFLTSEEYFLHEPVTSPQMPAFNPKHQENEITFSLVVSATQEVVVMVGPPSSGKRTLCKGHFRSYHYSYVAGGAKTATVKLRKFLKTTKRSVVVGGANPTREIRGKYVEIAREFSVPCRCFVMDVSRAQARHINKMRELYASKAAGNFDALLDEFEAAYEAPSVSEGFSAVVLVPFVPRYKEDEQKELYRCFLLAD